MCVREREYGTEGKGQAGGSEGCVCLQEEVYSLRYSCIEGNSLSLTN